MSALPWFLRDDQRVADERAGIDALTREVSWLSGLQWRVLGDLTLDCLVTVRGTAYELRLSYPTLYPSIPATVKPLQADLRLSAHQYGAGGSLCLEWGPDNWVESVSGADLLRSAHRLLDAENPLGERQLTPRSDVPSRHFLTDGQTIRSKWARWYCTDRLDALLGREREATIGCLKVSLRVVGPTWIALVHTLQVRGNEEWQDPSIPANLPDAEATRQIKGVWARTGLSKAQIEGMTTVAAIQAAIAPIANSAGRFQDLESLLTNPPSGLSAWILLDCDDCPHMHIGLGNGSTFHCTTVGHAGPDEGIRAPSHELLRTKRIGVVGLGAIGSKVALCLCRMGVRTFVLVDHDVLQAENLARHALDWQSVAGHKAEMVARSIQLIAADAAVDTSLLHLTGQESSAALSATVEKLLTCDLVIDATASGSVFNMTAALVKAATIPMVWAQVFAGGVGGLIARSRPGVDHEPAIMRSAFLGFCELNPAPPELAQALNYDLQADDAVIQASDAAVGIVAYHAASLVEDTLRSPDESRFPYSMYLLGMSAAWVFEAPFATIPIAAAGPTTLERTSTTQAVGTHAAFLASAIANGGQ